MTETPQERQEKARVRRRWLSLGELLAIAGVLISALALWNSYRERTASEAKQTAESVASERKAAILVLKAVPDKDGRVLALSPHADAQAIQSQTIRFPAALGISPIDTSSDARIERAWLESALVKARKEAGAKPETAGDARLPVFITTTFLADGDPHVDRAVYQIGYRTEHGFLSGTEVRLRGLSREGAAASDSAGQARIDALSGRHGSRTLPRQRADRADQAPSGVSARIVSAWTRSRSSSPKAWFTSRCRCTRDRPAKAALTTSTVKWLSPRGSWPAWP